MPKLLIASFIAIIAIPVLAEETRLIDGADLLETVKKQINNINTQQLRKQLQHKPMTLLIDVRMEDEINVRGGTIDSPLNTIIPRGWLETRIGEYALSKDTPIVTYCGANIRSPFAAKTLMDMGYTNVSNYEDGFFAWKDAGLPIDIPDKALDSFLYSMPIKVTDGVWSAIGATAPPTYANSGHNNNLSFRT